MTMEGKRTWDGRSLRAVADRLAATSVESGIGLLPVDLSPGRAKFSVPLALGASSAEDRVDPMTLSVIADTAISVAVFSEQPTGSAGVTAELCVDHGSGLGAGARALDVVAEALGSGPDVGTGRAEVRDDTGAVVAHAVGVVAIAPVRLAAPGPAPTVPRIFEPADARVEPVSPDSARVEIRPGMLNLRGTVHGGVLLGLVHDAQELFQLGLRAGCRPLQVSIDYLRPGPGVGHLVLRSSLVRRGHRLWIVRTSVDDADGRTVAVAHGTSAVNSTVPAGDTSAVGKEIA